MPAGKRDHFIKIGEKHLCLTLLRNCLPASPAAKVVCLIHVYIHSLRRIPRQDFLKFPVKESQHVVIHSAQREQRVVFRHMGELRKTQYAMHMAECLYIRLKLNESRLCIFIDLSYLILCICAVKGTCFRVSGKPVLVFHIQLQDVHR